MFVGIGRWRWPGAGAIFSSMLATAVSAGSFTAGRTLPAAEARQGVALDARYVYAIADRAIGKYDKHSGVRAARWQAGSQDAIIHLNSGVVVDGTLYCAHSNYPAVPMRSSIEMFEAGTLRHVGRHDFGEFAGSATWIDRHEGSWWVAFANYRGRGGVPGRGPEVTSLVRFDREWQVQARYSYPAAVIERFGTRSNSGGVWVGDAIYVTGHDAAEIYVLRLPRTGSVLELVRIVPAEIAGQGLAYAEGELWGVRKEARELVLLGQR